MKFTNNWRAKFIINEYRDLIKNRDKVLDIGSGNGNVSKIIQEKLKVDLIGIDIYNYNENKIKFKEFDGENIPFKDKSFKFTMFNGVLHHMSLENQFQILSEAKRVSDSILIFCGKTL